MNTVLIGMGMVAQTHILALRDNRAGARLTAVLGRDAARTHAFCAKASETLGHEVTPLTDMHAVLAQRPALALLITDRKSTRLNSSH